MVHMRWSSVPAALALALVGMWSVPAGARDSSRPDPLIALHEAGMPVLAWIRP